MSRLRFQASVSLDGFVAGPNPSEEHPLGEGGNSFAFVTDGIESALERAREAAGGKDVSAIGLEQERAVDAPGVAHLVYRRA